MWLDLYICDECYCNLIICRVVRGQLTLLHLRGLWTISLHGDNQTRREKGSMSSESVVGQRIRPPLSKKMFPGSRVGKNKASREVGNLFFFPNFICL